MSNAQNARNALDVAGKSKLNTMREEVRKAIGALSALTAKLETAWRADVAKAEAEVERLRAGRVTCSCGKDTAAVSNAQCYNCRQEPYHEIESCRARAEKAEAENERLRGLLIEWRHSKGAADDRRKLDRLGEGR